MRTFILTITAAAAVLTASAFTNRADATPIGNPTGLRHAIEDTDLTDKVHCRWGYPHHLRRWGRWDGCYRGLRSGYVAGPVVVFVGPRRHWRRRW
jgi:hypothetical protein